MGLTLEVVEQPVESPIEELVDGTNEGGPLIQTQQSATMGLAEMTRVACRRGNKASGRHSRAWGTSSEGDPRGG